MNQIQTGKMIKQLRQEKGYTQKQLAEYIHVSDKAVSKWERELCYPDIFLLTDLSEILGVSIDEMLGKGQY